MENLFRVNNLNTKMTSINVLLVPLLLTFNLSQTLFTVILLFLQFYFGAFIANFKQILRLNLFFLFTNLSITASWDQLK